MDTGGCSKTPKGEAAASRVSRRSKEHRAAHERRAASAVQESLTVRSFRPEDSDAVKRICRSHFRSLCFSAMKYYCLEHFRDLVALLVISKLFQPWRDVGLAALLFLVYLFARARIEMELYIFWECPDLDDLTSYYMSDPRSHFWVAEAKRVPTKFDAAVSPPRRRGLFWMQRNAPSGSRSVQETQVVGCVGCCPARDDLTVAQLLRLVVAADVRRMRHGSRLLAQFENFAKAKGYRHVRLYTNNLSSSHMTFIRQHGYVVLQTVPRPLMRGSLIEWKKQLVPLEPFVSDRPSEDHPSPDATGSVSSGSAVGGSFQPTTMGYAGAPPHARHRRSVSHVPPVQD